MSHTAARAAMDKVKDDAAIREKYSHLDHEGRVNSALEIGPQFGLTFTKEEFLDVETLKGFWRKVSENSQLADQVRAAAELKNREEVTGRIAGIADSAGFSVNRSALDETLQQTLSELGIGSGIELKEEQLEAVVGGMASTTKTSTYMCPW